MFTSATCQTDDRLVQPVLVASEKLLQQYYTLIRAERPKGPDRSGVGVLEKDK